MERASRRPSTRDQDRDADRGGGIAPGIAQSRQRKSDDDGDRSEHVGGEMQRVGRQRLALGVARGAMQRPGAPEIHRDIDQQHDERNRRERRRRRAFAQMAPGLHQDAAGQHIEHRDDAERRQALDLAVAVMMFLVGGAVGNPHHQPGDDGRDQIDRGVQRLGNQRETADGDADHEFGRGHAGAGENRNRGDAGFDVGNGVGLMGGGLAAHPCNIKARDRTDCAIVRSMCNSCARSRTGLRIAQLSEAR